MKLVQDKITFIYLLILVSLQVLTSFSMINPIINISISFIIVLLIIKPFTKGVNGIKNLFTSKKITINTNDYKHFIKYILIIFFCWLPFFLIYYPGIFAYDVNGQVGYYTTWQPLFHSLILNTFINTFTNKNIGLALYTILQMLLFASSLAYSVLLAYRLHINKKVRIGMLIYFSLCPIFSILSICTTKDVLFSTFFLYSIIILSYHAIDKIIFKKTRFKVLLVVSLVLVGLLRNNGLYIILIFCILNIVFLKDYKFKKICLYTMFFLTISFLTLLFSLKPLMDHNNEKYSAIYQQMGLIYKTKNLSKSDKVKIEKFIPYTQNYYPYFADTIKNAGKGYLHLKEFLGLSIKLFFKYPLTTINSIVLTNSGYWYIFDYYNTNLYRNGYFLLDFFEGYGPSSQSLFPKIKKILDKVLLKNYYQLFFVTAIIMNISLYFWIVIYLIIESIRYHKTINNNYLLIVLLLLTIFLGPCALVRYLLPCIVSVPALLLFNNYVQIKDRSD